MRRVIGILSVLTSVLTGITACAAEPDAGPQTMTEPVDILNTVAIPIEDARDLDLLIERAGERDLVLLGEASHGTSEFYTWRTEISRRLIEEKGFNFIAVEGDWATLYRLNRYVKGLDGAGPSARAIMREFDRWPPWMWANEEVEDLIEWLREFNAERPPEARVGFYGMDVYGPETSYRKVLTLIEEWNDEPAEQVREAYACLEAYADDFGLYARAVAFGMAPCDRQVRAVVELLRDHRDALEIPEMEYFNLKQNAWVVKNAEKHFRAMGRESPDSWNYRVDHFFQTVERLRNHYGPDAKGVAWAHNTHIGDARATSMAPRGQRNIGQIAREQMGPDRVFAVGFGTHRGTVMAGRSWGGPRERMTVPPGIPDSYEDIMHRLGEDQVLLMLDDLGEPGPLLRPIGHRAMGVIYHPERERGNYVPTILPRRYNAFIFIDETQAVRPIH